nr:hypothetical protein CFP56_41466 [Quercus suber]
MTFPISQSSTSNMRPAYMDNLFRDAPLPASPSLHSSTSSVSVGSSMSAFDLKLIQSMPRPLTPALENSVDGGSIRSLRVHFSPRFRIKNIFHRRTYPQGRESPSPIDRSQSVAATRHIGRRPSLPMLQTNLSSPLRRPSVQQRPSPGKPLPQEPTLPAQELSCHRCYYFAARNCNGWVMGGDHGDSCETCLNAGFFGAP